MGVDEVILDLLSADDVPDALASLVLAALISDDELARVAGGESVTVSVTSTDRREDHAEAKRAYLTSITVQGFRGIGERTELTLKPGPGLTLVTGRNGSGKSSFAEAAEIALTGDNKRWSGTGHSVERGGWRNLHHGRETRIDVGLSVDGEQGATTVTCEWAADEPLEGGKTYLHAADQARGAVRSLGWATAMQVYRPFLSYAELGALVSGKPSQMHDAIEAILGLGQLKDAETRLNDVRKKLDAASKLAAQRLPGVLARLKDHPDPRAAAAREELGKRTPDLDVLAALTRGDDGSGGGFGELRQIAGITLPAADDVATAIAAAKAAGARVAALAGTPAAEARQLAGLLTAALGHQRDHVGEPCPVCGGRPLDETWAETARAETTRLTGVARQADEADIALNAARRALADIVPAMPAVLGRYAGTDVDLRGAVRGWGEWGQDRSVENFAHLRDALSQVREAAAVVLRRRDDAWRPVADALADWLADSRKSREASGRLNDVRKAIAWLRDVGGRLRNERLAPFSEMSARVWAMLRQESNVELGPVTLAGTGPARKVSLDVTVDGVPGAALSVMSQGELHALGLALFLPRATADVSPFGFIVIDDPVQSMDPAKVDGLARLLADVARTRQVVVFTHDDRLPAAIRQLQLPATVWAVTRQEHSVVTLTPNDDPVQRYIDDAFALAMTSDLHSGVRVVAVAGLCRLAVEAACTDVTRARRIHAGVPHDEVEKSLEKAEKLRQKMALALFDDPETGDVMARLTQMNRDFGTVFRALNSGVHEAYSGDPKQLARGTERLTKALRQ
jgi:hypothetical protein